MSAMDVVDAEGKPIPAMLLVGEIDSIRAGLGWLLFHPSETVVQRSSKRGQYRIHVTSRGDVSPDIGPDTMRGLLKLGMITPSVADPHKAVGNPSFIQANPEWWPYITDPKKPASKRRRQP